MGHCEPKRLFPRAAQLGRTVRELGRSFHGPARLVVIFLGCRKSCRELAVLCSCSMRVRHPQELEQLAGLLRTQESLAQGSQIQKHCPRITAQPGFLQLSHIFCKFSGLQKVLQRAGHPVQLFCESPAPPRAGAAIWATANPRGSSPGQPDLEGLSEN